jgi:hypothetical protein
MVGPLPLYVSFWRNEALSSRKPHGRHGRPTTHTIAMVNLATAMCPFRVGQSSRGAAGGGGVSVGRFPATHNVNRRDMSTLPRACCPWSLGGVGLRLSLGRTAVFKTTIL